MINALQLKNEMEQCYGTENYYRYLGFSKFLYTDGVQQFCEKAEAYWFLDFVFAEVLRMKNLFLAIHLNVKNNQADVVFKDCGKKVKTRHIPFTDCPEGEWLFFFDNENKILMWCREY